MNHKISFWRYIIGIILYPIILLLGAVVVNVLMNILNVITPRYYQYSEYWSYFVGALSAAAIAPVVINKVVPSPKFCMIMCILGAVYLIFTAIYNFAVGYSEFYQFASILGSGVVSGVMAVQYWKECGANKENTKT